MWEPQIVAFSGGYHCIAPDLPAHGDNKIEHTFTISSAANYVIEVIEKLAANSKVHLVGLSMGAQIALNLFDRRPDLFASCLASSPSLIPQPGAKWLTGSLMYHSYKWCLQPLNNFLWWSELNRRYSAGVPSQYADAFFQNLQKVDAKSFIETLAANQTFRLAKDWQTSVPTLVVAGQGEHKTMLESINQLQGKHNVTVGLIEHDSSIKLAQQHNWSISVPNAFNQLLRAWFTEQQLPDNVTVL
ncbi:hypothetical protein CS022_11035 [Veronia nyctiphanis]|uniref:AB hydrolase-1 domain-containing protein n=2 Tax=Veronia nyctiphanis TaxID=1278244 RepID=A0A4Q0YQ79_9GAMM|nr:hypothetical protein CS022_11035 [Veronia nyctiphanis]